MTAYLNIHIDPMTLRATHAGIHTKPAALLPGCWATVLSSDDVSGTGNDPEGSLRRFVEDSRTGLYFSWVLPLLQKSA